jgi:hypothetical protein
MIILVGILIAGLIFVGMRIYQRETPAIVFAHGSGFHPIGGWLVLVAIGLVLTALAAVFREFSDNIFSLHTWTLYGGSQHEFNYKLALVYQLVGDTILTCYAVFCLVLLLNKRDILPPFIIGYFIYGVVFLTLKIIVVQPLNKATLTNDSISVAVRSFVIAAIWISYFKKSTRVEETFIVPYPPYNYSYEEPETSVKEQPHQEG